MNYKQKIIDSNCAMCGKVISAIVYKGKNNKVYIKYQDIWIRSRGLRSLCIFCEGCINKMGVLIEEKD
jgi:hypothetical protein